MDDEELMLLGSCTLDHDGCVVCADAGIPVRVVAIDGDDALCEDAAGNRMQVAVELVAPVRVGDVLLVHGGVAIGQVKRSGDGPAPQCPSFAMRPQSQAPRRGPLNHEIRQ
jgi:hydrogenase expression/formation protein HypC